MFVFVGSAFIACASEGWRYASREVMLGKIMNNKHLLDYIKQYNEEYGYRCENPADYLETLRVCGEEKYQHTVNERRWWTDIFRVVELDGKEIGYMDAETTGEWAPSHVGWEFKLSSICEVERHERTEIVVTYMKRTS
jgi:hypothetical protein